MWVLITVKSRTLDTVYPTPHADRTPAALSAPATGLDHGDAEASTSSTRSSSIDEHVDRKVNSPYLSPAGDSGGDPNGVSGTQDRKDRIRVA